LSPQQTVGTERMVLGMSSTAEFSRRDAETQRKNLDANCTNYHE
jgi:hypothetical protein